MTLRLDVWSDIACPWCYVGKRRLETALSRFAHREEVRLVWRAFELDPSAPRALDSSTSYAARLAAKYSTSVERAEAMIATMTETAAADGLDFRFDRIRAGNTFDAHRLLHFALEGGSQDALKERLLRAYSTEGEPIGEREVLARLAGEIGLDTDEARAILEGETYADEVRRDEAEARALGITGVPTFVVEGRFAVVGAQPAEAIEALLERVWRETHGGLEIEQVAEGATCGPEGCA